MNGMLAAALILSPLPFAHAEERLMEGGRSPDGQHEVRIRHEPSQDDPNAYRIRVYRKKGDKHLYTLESDAGYLHYGGALERCKALWHEASRCVAVTEPDSRHTNELYLLFVAEKQIKRLTIPDYVMNALGRVYAVDVDFACVTNLKHWKGDDLVVELHFTANDRHSYTTEVTLEFKHSEGVEPGVSLKSMSKPIEGGG